MESTPLDSTPRPITGYTRTWPSRIPLPLAALATGMRRLARPSRLAILMVRPDGEEAVVQVRGPLDGKGAGRLKLAVAMALEEGAKRVTIDLSEATRVGAAGVAALVEASQRADGRDVALTKVPEALRLILEKADLHRVLEIVE